MNRMFTPYAFAGAMLIASVALARQPDLVPPNAAPNPPIAASNYAENNALLDDRDGANCSSACEPTCEAEAAPCGEASCECDDSCGSDCGCGDACGCNSWSCLGDCCLGDAWTLSSCLTPCCECGPTYGGWVAIGYYNHNERLSRANGDTLSFNDLPHRLNMDQAWLYVEQATEADGCCADYGYRFDILYGAQGHTAQSFGNDGGTWDIAWDHGPYEWAIPQLYSEVAYGDWKVKVGHFFTPAGYEVVAATGNFFYSHALTHYNSEPFTHTGVLGTYSGRDNLTLYTGWALGWDTGFDQFGDGNIFLGGFGLKASDDITFTYITTVGNLGWRSGDEFGYTHHIVTNVALSDCLTYVLASDWVTTDGTSTDNTFENEDKSIVNYLVYKLNDCWSVGGRTEWWKSNNVVAGNDISFHHIAGGVNYKPHANVTLRPEIRYDWTPAADTVNNALGANYNQTWFGIDAIFTY